MNDDDARPPPPIPENHLPHAPTAHPSAGDSALSSLRASMRRFLPRLPSAEPPPEVDEHAAAEFDRRKAEAMARKGNQGGAAAPPPPPGGSSSALAMDGTRDDSSLPRTPFHPRPPSVPKSSTQAPDAPAGSRFSFRRFLPRLPSAEPPPRTDDALDAEAEFDRLKAEAIAKRSQQQKRTSFTRFLPRLPSAPPPTVATRPHPPSSYALRDGGT